MKNNLIIAISAVIAVILISGGLWYWYVLRKPSEEPLPTYLSEEATQALETAQNPVKNVAETNPFKKEETNPLLNKYKNPFE